MSPTLEAQAAQFLNLTKNLNSEERAIIINALQTFHNLEDAELESEDELIKALVLRTFTRQETIKLEMETLVRYFQRRRELLEDAIFFLSYPFPFPFPFPLPFRYTAGAA